MVEQPFEFAPGLVDPRALQWAVGLRVELGQVVQDIGLAMALCKPGQQSLVATELIDGGEVEGAPGVLLLALQGEPARVQRDLLEHGGAELEQLHQVAQALQRGPLKIVAGREAAERCGALGTLLGNGFDPVSKRLGVDLGPTQQGFHQIVGVKAKRSAQCQVQGVGALGKAGFEYSFPCPRSVRGLLTQDPGQSLGIQPLLLHPLHGMGHAGDHVDDVCLAGFPQQARFAGQLLTVDGLLFHQ